MDPFDARGVMEATGGSLVQGRPDAEFPLLSTDSRGLPRGALFLALKGSRHDAHAFVGGAIHSGAGGVVVAYDRVGDLPRAPADVTVIAVDDTLEALGRIANRRRREHGVPLVAITGSNGKTSTKEMVAALLETRGEVLKTPQNHNNRIGVPLTLLELTSRHRYAVIEMGTSEPGEIGKLVAIAEPTTAVITNIASAHTEGLRDVAGVAVEKGAIYEGLPATGTAVVNLDDPRCVEQSRRSPARRVTFGEAEAADVRIQEYRFGDRKPRVSGTVMFDGEAIDFDTNLVGFHHVRNVAAALAAAHSVGLAPRAVAPSLLSVSPQPHRMQFQEGSGLWILDDCYNANPESTVQAIETLDRCRNLAQPKARAIAVLGDMLELGPASEAAHARVGRAVMDNRIDVLITVGEAAQTISNTAREGGLRAVVHVNDAEGAVRWIRKVANAGDWLLVKGSRGMRLERVVDEVKRGELPRT